MKKMKKINLSLILQGLMLLSIHTNAQKIVKGFSSPESIVSDGKRYFVSNIGAGIDKIGRDGDGFISEISSEGKIISHHFLPVEGKLNAPHGMAVIDNILYVADIDKILGYNLSDRKEVFQISLTSSGGLLNDIVAVDTSIIIVSDTFKDIVYALNIKTKQITVIGSIAGPNGLAYDRKNSLIYVCTVGHLSNGKGQIFVKHGYDLASEWQQIKGSPTSGVFDGIEILDPSHIILSDWLHYPSTKGRLVIFDNRQKKYKSYMMGAEPADMYFDPKTKRIYLTQTVKDRLIIFNLKDLTTKKVGLID
jgi:DNA-binding beta-propeller fold protein YncE